MGIHRDIAFRLEIKTDFTARAVGRGGGPKSFAILRASTGRQARAFIRKIRKLFFDAFLGDCHRAA
jgi:hypothetical protein